MLEVQPLQSRLPRYERHDCLAIDPYWRFVDGQGVKLVYLLVEQLREQRLHLLLPPSYSDELDLYELRLITISYHLSEEVVEYLPWLVCFYGISTIKLYLFQLCALASENLEDEWRQSCDFSAVR